MNRKSEIFIVAVVIVVIFITGNMINSYLENERRHEEGMKFRADMEIEILRWQMKCEQDAIASYEEYIKDNETLDAFYTLREINPFLKKQMPYLREYMKILCDNITIENYETTYNQFILCYTMDKTYSENYSFYFQQMDEKYENMSYISHMSYPYINQMDYWSEKYRYLFAIESDYDSDYDEGFELEYYTDELEYYQNQIEYIYIIMGDTC